MNVRIDGCGCIVQGFILSLIILILKVINVITVSWWIVALPYIVSIAVVMIMFLITSVFMTIYITNINPAHLPKGY